MTFSGQDRATPTDFTGLQYQIVHNDQSLFDGYWQYDLRYQNHPMELKLSSGGVDVPPDLIRVSNNSFLPYIYVQGLTPEGGVNWEQATSRPEFIELLSELETAIGSELLDVLRSTHSARSYDNVLDSIEYLGPLRSNPGRIYTVQKTDRPSTGIRGEFTHELLSSRSNFVELANHWFNEFKIPYFITVDRFGIVDVTGEYISIGLVDRRTNTKVTLADVGFGINQLLPIIVEAVIPRTSRSLFGPLHTIICVEQPEIHLHPKLQAMIADLLIATSQGPNGKQWIVETHSELLIRRLQRRIAERTINRDDVSVIYVDPKEFTGSLVQQLQLDDYGEFVDEWPGGFFDEGFDEMMAY